MTPPAADDARAKNHGIDIPSLEGEVPAAEWRARVDLAACYRLIALWGMDEMIANHVSVRVPGASGNFLINAYGMLYEEITASSLIEIDLDGDVIRQPARRWLRRPCISTTPRSAGFWYGY